MKTMMKVICISEKTGSFIKNDKLCCIKKGDFYYISRESIWIDCDGDAYGEVYSTNNKYIGQMRLSHFQSL